MISLMKTQSKFTVCNDSITFTIINPSGAETRLLQNNLVNTMGSDALPWYWLCTTKRSLSSMREDLSTICPISVLRNETRATLMPKYPWPPRSVYGTTLVVLWNSHTVKQSMWWFCLTTAVESPFHICCAFSMCTGVQTVKQSLNSIETNQELFHSLNAHHHNANK